MSAPVDTRLGPGSLKIGAPLVDYGAQLSNVTLEPSQDSSDGTPTLGDPDPLPELSESWVLSGTAIQDFEAEAGFVNYCFDHALAVVPFEWIPNSDAGTKWTGNVQVTSLPIGGDVSVQNTSDFSFAVQGTPVRVAGSGLEEGGSRAIAAARSRRRSSLAPAAATRSTSSSSKHGAKASS